MIDINCDMGEGIGNEATLMPYISSANIACGYHAGNRSIMLEVIRLCIRHGVNIGAHPSFPDRENFGRTAMSLPVESIYELVLAQLQALAEVAAECNARIFHAKPHGALYNMAATDAVIARTIAEAVNDFEPSLVLFGLSGSFLISEATKLGLRTANEVFADRSYQSDGTLTPRGVSGAVLTDNTVVENQVSSLVKGSVTTITGELIRVSADTICIHGDGAHAVEFAQTVYKVVHGQ